MPHHPLTRQRSPWVGVPSMTSSLLGITAHWFLREVGDGSLWACVAEEPLGWHMSISFRDHNKQLTRYPTWDEIVHARNELTPPDVEFAMFLPRQEEYVNLHETTFHLHEHPERAPMIPDHNHELDGKLHAEDCPMCAEITARQVRAKIDSDADKLSHRYAEIADKGGS